MPTMFVGDYIKRRRKELELTQEQLCEGICDATTVSRLETGFQAPRRTILNALLQRLGLPDTRYFAVVTKSELDLETLEKEIVACHVQKHWQEGWAKLEKLREIAEPEDTLTWQFVLRSEALLGGRTGRYTYDQQRERLLCALRLTVPRFTLESIDQFLYTVEEIKILNQIANSYSRSGQLEQTQKIQRALVEYVRIHYQELLEQSELLSMLLQNYAHTLCRKKEYKASIAVCEEGRKASLQYGHCRYFPAFFAIMAECYFFLEDPASSADCYIKAYYLYETTEDWENLQLIRQEAKERLGLALPVDQTQSSVRSIR